MPLPLLALGAGKAALGFFRSLPLTVYLAIGVAAAFGFLQWKHAREVGGLREDIAALTLQIKDEQLKTKTANEARLIVEKNRVELQAALDRQSAEVAQLAAKSKQAEAAANVAAVRAFNQGRAEAEKLRAPTSTVPSGAPGMNAWLSERLVTP